MQETCDTCHEPYDFTPANAKLVLFLNYPKASHVEARCTNPECGVTEIIYTSPQAFMEILGNCQLSVAFGLTPTPERREACDATWDKEAEADSDEVVYTTATEIETPHWMLRELFDQMREYEGSN